MDIKNLEEAMRLKREYAEILEAIEIATAMVTKAKTEGIGLNIGEYSDESGLYVDKLFQNGDFSPVGKAIAKALLKSLLCQKRKLDKSIKEL